jgi:ATP-dependent Clp protease protease subunit
MSRSNLLDNFFDYGVDYRKRIIYLGNASKGAEDYNEVSYTMAEYAIKGLIVLDSTSDSPINLIINSPGGIVNQGLAIYDAIQQCRCHVKGLIMGEACSMASLIVQACDERTITPHSTMMIHKGSVEVAGNANDVYSYISYDKTIEKMCEDIYLKRIKEKHPRFTRKALQEMLSTDKWMTAKEVVKLGLADDILEFSG